LAKDADTVESNKVQKNILILLTFLKQNFEG